MVNRSPIAPRIAALTLAASLLSGIPKAASATGDDEPHYANQHQAISFDELRLDPAADVTLDVSADGSMIAYSWNRAIYVDAMRTPDAPVRVGDGLLPQWAPDGRSLAFLTSEHGGLQFRIWFRDTGETRDITNIAGGVDPDPKDRISGFSYDAFRYSWSPDGRAIAFATRVAESGAVSQDDGGDNKSGPIAESSPRVFSRDTPPSETLRGVFASDGFPLSSARPSGGKSSEPAALSFGTRLRTQLFIVSTNQSTVKQLTMGDGGCFNPAWSPDGHAVACVRRIPGNSPAVTSSTQIVLIDPATGAQHALTTGNGLRSRPEWSPDGSMVAFLLKPSHWEQQTLVVMPVDDRQRRTTFFPLDRNVIDYSWAGRTRIAVVVKDGVSIPIWTASLSGTKFKSTIDKINHDKLIAASSVAGNQNGALAWFERGPHVPDRIVLQENLSAPRTIVELTKVLPRDRTGTVSIVRWKNTAGDSLEGTLLLPPDATRRGAGPLPLIVDAYPLVSGTDWTDPLMGNFGWSSRGYAVFRPSPRAPHAWVNPWTDSAWSSRAKGPDGWAVTLDDLLTGIDQLVERGIVDHDRMTLYGFSNGAAVTNYVITATNRFKCAVSIGGGLADWGRRALLETDSDWISEWAGADIRENPEQYIALSAVYRTDRVKTPTLLVAGDNDYSTLLDTIEMYNGLRKAGVDVTMLRYPGQGHVINGSALRDLWSRELDFLEQCLKKK